MSGGLGSLGDLRARAIFGLIATAALTAVMIGAQLAGRTRLHFPLMLGTIVVADPRSPIGAAETTCGEGFRSGFKPG